jgi:hypothetical protein
VDGLEDERLARARVARTGLLRSGALCLVLAALVLGLYPAPQARAQANVASGETVIGEQELVLLDAGEEGDVSEVLAKTDTGAGYSSIDDDLARDLGIDIEDPPATVTIQSATGEEERPLVPLEMSLAGREIQTRVTVAEREDLSTDMILGTNDLAGFLVKTGQEQLTTPTSPTVETPVAALLEFPPPPPAASTLLAALPLAAALIVAARTLIGIQTFGLFAPVLLSVAFVQTGIPAGLFLFAGMFLCGIAAQYALKPLMLPRAARLAVILSVGAAVLLGVNYVVSDPSVTSTWAGALPIVVISVTIERFWEIWEQESFAEALKPGILTVLVALLACPLLVAEPVRWISMKAPIVAVLCGLILCLLIGRYRGLRLTEFLRFRRAATEGAK